MKVSGRYRVGEQAGRPGGVQLGKQQHIGDMNVSLEHPLARTDNHRMGVNEELRALGHVVDRLADQYPDVPREHIEDIVQQEHRSLDEGRVRDFVPILVEHAAKDRLSRLP